MLECLLKLRALSHVAMKTENEAKRFVAFKEQPLP